MAADGEVVYKIRGDDSQIDGDLDKAGQKIEKGTSKWGGVMKTAGAAIGGAAIAAGAAAIKLGMDFETSMAGASTLFGDAKVNMDDLNGKMLSLSDSTGIAASELGNSLYNALSAGIPATDDMGEAMGFLEKSSKLAKAGFTDIDTAMSATVKTLNAYGMGVEETDRIQKVLMQTQNKGIVTVGELGSVLAQVTPTAASMGVEFEQVGAAIAVMTAAGTPAAQSTTQLNQLFSELGKSGTKADLALRNMTATVKAASKEQLAAIQASNDQAEKSLSKSLDNRVSSVEKSYKQQEKDLEKSLKAELAAVEEATNKRLELVDREYKEKLKLVDEEKYNQLKAIDDQIDGINQKAEEEEKRAKEKEKAEKLAALQAKVSTAETSEDRAEAEKDLAEYKEQLRQEQIAAERKAQIATLESQKKSIEEAAKAKKDKLQTEYDTKKLAVQKETKLQKEAIQEQQALRKEAFAEQKELALKTIRDTNAAELDALKATNALKLEYAKNGSGDGKGFSELLNDGKNLNEILEILQQAAEESGVKLSDMFSSVDAGKAALAMSGENASKFTETLSSMSTETDVVGEAFDKVTGTTAEDFNKSMNKLKNTGISLFEKLEPLISKLLSILGKLLDDLLRPLMDLLDPIIDLIMKLLDPILDLIGDALTPLKEALQPIIDIIRDTLSPIIKGLGERFRETFEAISGLVKNQIQTIRNVLSGIIDFIKNIFTGNWKGAWEAVKNIFGSIWEGIKNVFKIPINWIIDGINGFLKGLNKIKIPDWVPLVGGKGINIPLIPRLKKGMNFVPSDYYPAYLDYGERVLTAEQNMKFNALGGLNGMDLALSSKLSDVGKNRTITIVTPVEIDGREVARATATYTSEQMSWEEL